MPRALDLSTLEAAADYYASEFPRPDVAHKFVDGVFIGGRGLILQNLKNIHFKDEYDFLISGIKGYMGVKHLASFEAAIKDHVPREDAVFHKLLADRLAIDPEGKHIPGKVGTSVVGNTLVGNRMTRHGTKPARWSLYAGEAEERALGNVRVVGEDGPGADPLPPPDTFWGGEEDHLMGPSKLFTLVTNVSIAFAQAGVNAAVTLLDEGSLGAVIQGYSGAQPVDPDAANAGTLAFTLTCSATAFPGATDAAPGALKTASAITDDTSADNTVTLLYCRASSSNVADTALNDHIDGHADTSAGDFNFNTLAIVSGATVSMTSWTITQPQGPTAS